MTDITRDNYYLLLELDPTVEDQAVIDQAIQEKTRRWSIEKNMGDASKRCRAANNLHQISKIKEVMRDPEKRSNEAKDANQRILADRNAILNKLGEIIKLLRTKGGYTEQDVSDILKRVGHRIEESDVREQLKSAGLSPFGEETTFEDRKGDTLSPIIMDQMRPDLESLKYKNLYEFLGIGDRASTSSLIQRANALYQELNNDGKTDPISTAKQRLCGRALALFRDEREKEKYDNALIVEVMDSLKDHIEIAVSEKFLSSDMRDNLILLARERGVPIEYARKFLQEYVRKRDIPFQREKELPSDDLPQCGYCKAIARIKTAKRCDKCGKPLTIPCPRCKTEIPTAHAACTHCGCRIGDDLAVEKLKQESQRHIKEYNFDAAQTAIDSILSYWPGWPPALELQQEVAIRRTNYKALFEKIHKLQLDRKLLEARAELQQVAHVQNIPSLNNVQKTVNEDLARAEQLTVEAEELLKYGQQEEALVRYEQAVTIATDLTRARTGLARFPPLAPVGLQIAENSNGFRLNWKADVTRRTLMQGLSGLHRHQHYRVLRKIDSQPQDRDDGTIVAEINEFSFDDNKAPIATIIYYAIYSEWNGVYSNKAAVAGPLFRVAEIEALEVLPSDSMINLRWKQLSNCIRVEARRSVGKIPTHRGDGVTLPTQECGLVDIGLNNGVSYGYLLMAVYGNPDAPGTELISNGIGFVTSPVPLPQPVLDLQCKHRDSYLDLSWTPPADGAVQIRKIKGNLPLVAGSQIQLSKIEQYGVLLISSMSGYARCELDGELSIVLLPITILNSSAVLGKTVRISIIEDIRKLEAHHNGSSIILTWVWPTEAEEVLICYRKDCFPKQPDELEATKQQVKKIYYQRNNYYSLWIEQPCQHYFTLFVFDSNSKTYSSGVSVYESMGLKTKISYIVKTKKLGWFNSNSTAWIELTTNSTSDFTLPDVVVRAKKYNVPISDNDGDFITETTNGLVFSKGHTRIDLPNDKTFSSTYFKLFFKEDHHVQYYHLMPESNAKID